MDIELLAVVIWLGQTMVIVVVCYGDSTRQQGCEVGHIH